MLQPDFNNNPLEAVKLYKYIPSGDQVQISRRQWRVGRNILNKNTVAGQVLK